MSLGPPSSYRLLARSTLDRRATNFSTRPLADRVALIDRSEFFIQDEFVFHCVDRQTHPIDGRAVGFDGLGSLLVWDFKKKELGVVNGSEPFERILTADLVTMSQDGRTLAAVQKNEVVLFDRGTGQQLCRLPYQRGEVQHSVDGRAVGLSSVDGIVDLYRTDGCGLGSVGVAEPPSELEGLMVSWGTGYENPLSQWRLLDSDRVLFKSREDEVSLLSLGEERPEFRISLRNLADYTVATMKISRGGSWAAFTRQHSGALHLLDLSTGEARSLEQKTEHGAVSFSPDESVLAAVCDNQVRVWKTNSGDVCFAKETPGATPVDLQFTHEGHLVCLLADDATKTSLIEYYEPDVSPAHRVGGCA